MDEYIALLKILEAEHLTTAVKSKSWVDYLKVHGIANHLVALDPSDLSRRRRVYDIERQWYNDKHPLTYTEHQDLSRKHKQQLSEYREKTRDNFDSLRTQQESLDIDEIFSEENLDNAHEFSRKVFINSKICSDDFVEFSRSIIESSVDCLKRIGLTPPCPFAVIALGSVARGEATPYSDLEYAFIVEKEADNKCFEKLAVDTYFKIGNLNESPLKTFAVDLEEFKDKSNPRVTSGFRIDGLSKNAGHIPTGNGTSRRLTFTVEQAMNVYREELMSSNSPIANLSNLLSSSVLIYTYNGGEQLHEAFLIERLKYEKEVAESNLFVKAKRVDMLLQDLKNYSFLPEFEPTPRNTNVLVKVDIFRYPTLLGTDLNICLGTNSQCPWQTYSMLRKLEILTNEDLRYLNIILGLSIYIRTSSYLAMQTKLTHLSLYTCGVDADKIKDRYYVPKNVFVTLGCLLTPVKNSIFSNLSLEHALRSNLARVDMVGHLKSLIKPFRVESGDFMLKAEVLYFIGDVKGALLCINIESGRNLSETSCIELLEVIRQKYSTNKSDLLERKYLRMCYYILTECDLNKRAIDFLSWLISYTGNSTDIAYLKMLLANELNALGRYKSAKNVLIQVFVILKNELELDEQSSLSDFVLNQLNTKSGFSQKMITLYDLTCSVYERMGATVKLLDDPSQSLEYFEHSLKIHQLLVKKDCIPDKIHGQIELGVLLNNIGSVHGELENNVAALASYNKALEIWTATYGEHTNHPSIASCLNNIGSRHSDIGNYEEALNYLLQALSMWEAIYGGEQSSTGIYYNNIGMVYRSLGNSASAIEYFTKALKVWQTVDGGGTNQPDIASCYDHIGSAYSDLGCHTKALEFLHKALHIRETVYGTNSNHSEIAIALSHIGGVHQCMGEFITALEYHKKALKMRKALYGEDTNHSQTSMSLNNIGLMHACMGDAPMALEYYTESLQMLISVYNDTNPNHPYLLRAFENVLSAHIVTEKYRDALSLCNRILTEHQPSAKLLNMISQIWIGLAEYDRAQQILQFLIAKTANNCFDQAENYYQMGVVCLYLRSWRKCWCWLYSALTLYQSLPRTSDSKLSLAKVNLSISHLLLQLDHVTQSLEHAQRALDISKELLAIVSLLEEYTKINRNAESIINTLHMLKICRYQISSD